MQRLQNTALSTKNISSALLLDTYTADADRQIMVGVSLSGLAGNGTYKVCLTRQRAGSGAVYQSPTTAISLAATVTTAYIQTITMAVLNTDVVKVYAVGLAGDTSVAGAVETWDTTLDAVDLAAINAQVDAALNTAIPGSPTADSINERIKALDDLTQASGGGDLAALLTRIGTPANIDSGGATIADNLKKLADDNGGASFDATVSSLNKLSTAVVTGVPSTLQASANTETTGTLISGTYASTYLSNGTSWVTAPVTPAVAESGSALSPFGLNANLRFTAGTGQTINSVSIRGNFAAGPGRYVNVYAYNYATTTWDMLSDVGTRMNNTTTLTTYTYTLLAAHQKTDAGGDGVGAIRIGFKSPSTTTGDRLNVDLCLVNVATAGASAADIADAVYAKLSTSVYGRQVWIDTVNGVDGYVIGVNGLDHTPVLTIACAYQLCDDLGLKTIAFKSGSNTTAVTLTRSAAGWRFYGPGKINLGGQIIADAIFEECYSVYGTSTGDDASFYRCQIGSGGITLDHAYITDCRIKGAITLIANADPIIFHNCIDATGAAADFELIFVANASAIIRNFQGALTLKDMAATNSVVIDGACRVTIDASSTAGSITLRGFADLPTGATGNTFGTSGTITQTARYATDQINAQVDAALADYDGPTNTEFEARTLAAADYVVVGDTLAAVTTVGSVTGAVGSVTGLTASDVGNIKAVTDKLNTTLVLDGAVYDFTAAALAAAPSGSGLDAAGVRAAIGMAAANLDTQLGTVAKTGGDSDTLETLSDQLDAIPTGSSALTAQETRDAMKLAPSSGAAAAGSIDTHLDSIQAKTDTIGALSVTVVAPVATSGEIQIVRGDDYLNTDGRALSFTLTSCPSISGGSVALRVMVAGAVVSYAGVVTGAAACYVELTTAQTALLPGGSYPYDLQITLSNSSIITPQQGTMAVTGDVR